MICEKDIVALIISTHSIILLLSLHACTHVHIPACFYYLVDPCNNNNIIIVLYTYACSVQGDLSEGMGMGGGGWKEVTSAVL